MRAVICRRERWRVRESEGGRVRVGERECESEGERERVGERERAGQRVG